LARSDRAKLINGIDPKEDRRKAKEEQEKAKKDAEEKALKAAYTLEKLKRDFIIHKRQNETAINITREGKKRMSISIGN